MGWIDLALDIFAFFWVGCRVLLARQWPGTTAGRVGKAVLLLASEFIVGMFLVAGAYAYNLATYAR